MRAKNIILFISVLIFTVAKLSYTQISPIYKPFTKLYIIETEKFDIIFPIESKRTAIELSKIADDIYKKHSKLFQSDVRGRVPVNITPHVNIFNGFFSPVAYPTIVLFDTPMDGDFTTQKDNLEGLFLHELMHALSLASTNNGPQTKIFGEWLTTTELNALGFMLEGVTVSYESLDGFGRANDPLIKEFVRQDIIENKFKTPIQATGVWEHLGAGAEIYNYGGLFAKYLQEKYGMEKYNAWWFKISRTLYFSFILDNHGVYEAFERVYDKKFSVAWNEFREYMSVHGVENNNLRITKSATIINDVASFQDNVYYLDNDKAILKAYNNKTKKIKNIVSIDKTSESINISPLGDKALIGSVSTDNGLYKYIIREYNFIKKRYTKKYKNLRYADYFRDGIVAIDKDLKNTTIVYVNSNGYKELLLQANNNLSYYYPNVIDDNLIALIVVENGVKSLRILDYSKRTLSKISTPLANDSDIWKYIQYLNYSEGKLTFAYNDNDRMYKLGLIDITNKRAIFYTNDYSGGVYNAVANGTNFYYSARFSTQYSLMKYPETETPINTTYRETSSINISSIENVATTFETSNITNNIEKFHYKAKYLNPFNTWFLVPLTNDTYRYFFNGVGILSIMTSPTLDTFTVINMGYDIPSKFLQTELSIKTHALLYPIEFSFYDSVVYSYSGGYKYWSVGASLSQSFRFDLSRDISGIYLVPFVKLRLHSDLHNIDDTSSAFSYKYKGYNVSLGTSVRLYYINRTMKYYNMDLASIRIMPIYSFVKNNYYIESEAKLQSKYIPARLRLYGSYSPLGVGYDGTGYFSSSTSRGEAIFYKYVLNKGYMSTWITGGNAEVFHAFNIDKNLSHFYFNNIFLSIIYSATYYDIEYMHSIGLKLGTRVQVPVYGPYPVIVGEPNIKINFMLPSDKNKISRGTSFLDIVYLSFALNFSF